MIIGGYNPARCEDNFVSSELGYGGQNQSERQNIDRFFLEALMEFIQIGFLIKTQNRNP